MNRTWRVWRRRPAPKQILSAIVFALVSGAAMAQNESSGPKAPTAAQRTEAEAKIVRYLSDHLQPGQPVLITELAKTFAQPAEKLALGKLYSAFFRIPLFVAGYQEKFGHPPSLATISGQFDLHAPGEADVLLRIMQSDPRVPRFLTRDPQTGAITKVDVALVRSDPHFGQALDHQIAGWEGRPGPPLTLQGIDGKQVTVGNSGGKALLLEVWFTGCPPCMQETPVLVGLQHRFGGQGLSIIGANADKTLGLSYTDAERERYIRDHKIDFSVAHWDKAADQAYGGISIFPTIFLMDSGGVVRQHWVGFVKADELAAAVSKLVTAR